MGNTNKSCNCKLEGIGVSIQQTSKNTWCSYFPSLGKRRHKLGGNVMLRQLSQICEGVFSGELSVMGRFLQPL